MTYSLPPTNGPSGVVRDLDGAFIPADPANTDWQAYQTWFAGGNTPTPAPAPALFVPETISSRQLMQVLATDGDITWDECFAYLGQGAIPTIFANAIAQIPTDTDPNAQNKAKAAFIGADSFDRHNPTTMILGQLIGKTDAQLDAIWIAGNAIV